MTAGEHGPGSLLGGVGQVRGGSDLQPALGVLGYQYSSQQMGQEGATQQEATQQGAVQRRQDESHLLHCVSQQVRPAVEEPQQCSTVRLIATSTLHLVVDVLARPASHGASRMTCWAVQWPL